MPRDGWVLTIDVEWAHPEVLADLVGLLDERRLRATFFCTHAGLALPGHERALHPNFRRTRNTLLQGRSPEQVGAWDDDDFYRFVVRSTQAFCPEAVGVRAHSLLQDSALLPIYQEAGLEYDSSCFLPLNPGIVPVRRGHGLLTLPIYYLDHWDLREQATGFALDGLQPDAPGLKIVDFHPNLVFTNAATLEQYTESKAYYHDPDRLRRQRHPGRGVRTLFLELLDYLAAHRLAGSTLAEVNAQWRNGGD